MSCYHLMIEMQAKGMTYKKLAQYLNLIEQVLVSKINGETTFTKEEVKHIEKLFPNHDIAFLLNGSLNE